MITSDEFTFFQAIYVQIMEKCWFWLATELESY